MTPEVVAPARFTSLFQYSEQRCSVWKASDSQGKLTQMQRVGTSSGPGNYSTENML